MSILLCSVFLWGMMGAEGPAAGPTQATPTTYELMINGESFLLEANRLVKLQSKLHPNLTYEVAIRVSPVQYLRLNQIRLTYDLRTKVEDNRQAERRSVRLSHPQGCYMLITEIEGPLAQTDRDKALQMLTESVVQSYQQRQISDGKMELTRLENTQFSAVEARGVQIRYQDAQGIRHRSLIYLLVGKTFTCSCIIEYLDADEAQVLPIIKRTLDSIEPIRPSTTSPPPAEKPKD